MNKVNLWAVIVAAVVHWLLGALWFGVIFGNIWMAGSRFTPQELEYYKTHPDPWPYVITFFANLVMALVIAKFISAVGQWSAGGGLRVGLMAGFGIAFAAMVTEMVFEYRSHTFILISAGYPVVGCMLMGAILGAWKPKGV
jgi:hypothetical protein